MKVLITVYSDPKSGGEEALGRVFNALSFASESKAAGDDVAVVFAGAGVRWPEQLAKLSHPAHGLFESVRDVIAGASCGCAASFEATAGVEACGVSMLKDHKLDGTPGLASIRSFLVRGFQSFTF